MTLTSTHFFQGLTCELTGLLLTLALTPLVRFFAFRHRWLDRVEQLHHTHKMEIPRIGGLALILSLIPIWILSVIWSQSSSSSTPPQTLTFLISLLSMFTLGFVDDIRPLPAEIKLLTQILIASGTWMAGLRIETLVNPLTGHPMTLEWSSFPVTVFWLVSVTNLINLVDGLDGLASGIVLIILILLAIVSWMSGNFFVFLFTAGMSGSLLAFLMFNFPPARIFLGDGGAYFLGLLIGEVGILNSNNGAVAAALMIPFFALGLPIIDTVFSVLRRAMVGLPIFRADRHHIHHRLISMGFSRRRVVFLLYAICLVFALLSLTLFIHHGQWLSIYIGAFMLIAMLSAHYFGFIQNWLRIGHVLTQTVIRRKHTSYALLLAKLLRTEASQCQSQEELWKNFEIILQKLHFQKATLETDGTLWTWQNSSPSNPPWNEQNETRGTPNMKICLTDQQSLEDPQTRRLLGELMIEAWFESCRIFRSKSPRSDRSF